MRNRKTSAPAIDVVPRKNFGRVYTPEDIVDEILDRAGYVDGAVLRKHAIDNSCGDGAFLCRMVERYCRASDGTNLKRELETFIHGIEVDATERASCVRRLDEIAARFGVCDVCWDVLCADALSVDRFDGKMDFALGNPPYVRVHHLGDSFETVKRFDFARDGMTDLYLVFYELGLRSLNARGTLGYITPSSFFNSSAGRRFRARLIEENLLDSLVDLGRRRAFDASTYTAIVVLKKSRATSEVDFFEWDAPEPRFVERLRPEDFYIDDKFYFSTKEGLIGLKTLLTGPKRRSVAVKNGFATLADSFFIAPEFPPEFDEWTIPIVKASTGKRARCVFPYREGRPVEFERLASAPKVCEYFLANRSRLERRSLAPGDPWFAFGRSQGLCDVGAPKYSVNTLIRNVDDLKIEFCPPGVGVYSGLYFPADENADKLVASIRSERFAEYAASLRKYKSSGYFAFSSRDLQSYLERIEL